METNTTVNIRGVMDSTMNISLMGRLRELADPRSNLAGGFHDAQEILNEAAGELERWREWGHEARMHVDQLNTAVDALIAAIRNHDLTEAHVRACEMARHGQR